MTRARFDPEPVSLQIEDNFYGPKLQVPFNQFLPGTTTNVDANLINYITSSSTLDSDIQNWVSITDIDNYIFDNRFSSEKTIRFGYQIKSYAGSNYEYQAIVDTRG